MAVVFLKAMVLFESMVFLKSMIFLEGATSFKAMMFLETMMFFNAVMLLYVVAFFELHQGDRRLLADDILGERFSLSAIAHSTSQHHSRAK